MIFLTEKIEEIMLKEFISDSFMMNAIFHAIMPVGTR